MDIKELRKRQEWTFEQKIYHAIEVISTFKKRMEEQGKTPYVSTSGGKDSTVVLDIARRFVDPNIKAVFCNTGNEFPEIVKFVKQTENLIIIRPEMSVREILSKYGFPLISKEQARYIREVKKTKNPNVIKRRFYGTTKKKYRGKISDCWKFLIHAPFDVSEKCCYYLKKKPFRQYNKETGEVPILGIMAEESILREQQYITRGSCNSFTGQLASYPISIFVERDIWEYKRRFNIAFSPIYNIPGVRQTGCMFCGFGAHLERGFSRFELLYTLHPKAYNLFMNYVNRGVCYRVALRMIGVHLPDENRQLKLFDN